jgi:hypothetical protein
MVRGIIKLMKKLLIIILLIAVSVFLYTRLDMILPDKTVILPNNENKDFRPDPSSATFTIDDEAVTLSQGRNEQPLTSSSHLTEETTLLDLFAYGDLNSDDKDDTALFLSRNSAGSGTFFYLAAYLSGPVTYKGSEALFIGDRIIPQSIAISQDRVTIHYLDRKTEESFNTTPSIPVTKHFIYKNGSWQEK